MQQQVHRHRPAPPLGRIKQLHQATEEGGPCAFCGKAMAEWKPMEECSRKMVALTLLQVMEGSPPHRLRYTFKHEQSAISAIQDLVRMQSAQQLRLSNVDTAILIAVLMDRAWGSNENRTVTIDLLPAFDWEQFVYRMSDACYTIAPARWRN